MLRAAHRRGSRAASMASRAWVAAALALGTPACTRDLGLLATPDAATGEDRPQMDASRPGDATDATGAGGTSGAGGASGLCGSGRVRFPDASGTCASTLAARAHRYAVCSCGDWSLSAPLSTNPFSSNPTAYPSGPVSAAVGVNGKLTTSASLSILGSLYASGPAGISTTDTLEVYKTLHSAGPLAATMGGTASVYGTDAYVAGDVTGAVHVAGTLHLPSTAVVGSGVTSMVTTRETVSVADPCDCSTPFDVTSIISATSTANDNASISLDPDFVVNPSGVINLDIPCGRFFLSSIISGSMVNLKIHGRALLAIAGGVTLSQGLTVQFDPGAELDLLVGGALTSHGPYPVGAYTPAPLRVWMAGSSPISLYGNPIAGGIFRAPLSDVTVPDGMYFYGAMIAASFDFGGAVQWNYDQLVLNGGVVCGDPSQDPVQ